MNTVVVVPTYNERENIEPLVVRILEVLPGARVLIVDDGSPDGTGEAADSLAAQYGDRVHVLHRPRAEGLGKAYVAGYRHALDKWPDAAYFIQMDADFSHDPVYLPQLLRAMDEADVAVGSRYVNGISIVNWPLHRLIVSQFGTFYARTISGLPVTDCTSGFKCYRAEVLRALNLESLRSNGYVFQIECLFVAWRLGYRLKDVPIIFYERTKGVSKLNPGIAWEAFYVVLGLGLQRLFSAKKVRATAGGGAT